MCVFCVLQFKITVDSMTFQPKNFKEPLLRIRTLQHKRDTVTAAAGEEGKRCCAGARHGGRQLRLHSLPGTQRAAQHGSSGRWEAPGQTRKSLRPSESGPTGFEKT